MKLQSMTGFSRAEGENDHYTWSWDLRSVNGKGLDIRFRAPAGYEAVEIKARRLVQSSFKRGSLQIGLQVQKKSDQQSVVINKDLVEELISVAKKLQSKIGGDMPGPAELLSIKGVVELDEGVVRGVSEDQSDQILETLTQAVGILTTARLHEGHAIGKVLLGQVSTIEETLLKIEGDPSRSPDEIKNNLREQVERLVSSNESLDENRLHQEVAVLAVKADIQEEIDRLKVHTVSARKLLGEGGAVGRKLDFLAQEFNRECNTICSKSNSAAVTAHGLDMKLVIDQFREQLQNME